MNINDFLELLKADVKLKFNIVDNISEAFIWGISVFGILFFFRPFGLSDSNLFYLFTLCLGYGSVTFISVIINLLITKRILHKYLEHSWTKKYEILLFFWITLLASVLNLVYSSLILREFPFTYIGFLRLLAYTTSLLSLIFIIKQSLNILIKYNTEKIKLDTKIEYYKELKDFIDLPVSNESLIKLSFENEDLELQFNRVVLISAWGNYIKILVDQNGKKTELVKRGKIKEIERQLLSYPKFLKCHRSYIINTHYIAKIQGNTKKASILVKIFDLTIPIAREKTKDFLKIFP